MNNKKKALVLAGGYDQIALIAELRKKKYYIILADYLDNPPAKKEADCFMQVSTLDEQAIYDIAKTEQVDTIITACTDQALLTVANVSEKLHMPFYLSRACALSVTNKFYMKQKFEENNIPTATYKLYENKMNQEEFNKLNDFPYVVKPCDCNSSKGVQKVENIEQLRNAVDMAFYLSRSNKVVVEKYISGYEISIDVWVKDYEPLILDVTQTNKMNTNTGAFTIYQSFYSRDNISYDLQHRIYEILKKISTTFDIKDGPMLVQAIVKDDNVFVLEFSARMGGGSKYKLIEYISGVDIMKLYTDFVVDNINPDIKLSKENKLYEMDYIYAYNGVIKRIDGLKKAKQEGIIKEFFQYKEKNSEIKQRLVSSDRVIGVLLEAESVEEMSEKRKKILEVTRIIDSNGKDIMYRKCFDTRG